MNLRELAEEIHQTAVNHGWWEANRNWGEMLFLASGELVEAFEEWRKGKPAMYFQSGTPGSELEYAQNADGFGAALAMARGGQKPEGQAIEIADCIIRLLDTAHSQGWDMDQYVKIKMAYNDTRPYRHGGLKA